jgi:Flp pilus assembly protein TadG
MRAAAAAEHATQEDRGREASDGQDDTQDREGRRAARAGERGPLVLSWAAWNRQLSSPPAPAAPATARAESALLFLPFNAASPDFRRPAVNWSVAYTAMRREGRLYRPLGAVDARRLESGQSLVELAVSVLILMLLLSAAMDFGFLFSDRLAISNGARVGVRWATKNPTNWSASSTPDSTSIEGQIQIAGGTGNIPNDDSHIAINYYDVNVGAQTLTYCGRFSQANNAFQAAAGYTQATCVVKGHVIEVVVDYDYPVLTPAIRGLFGNTVLVKVAAAMVEEV